METSTIGFSQAVWMRRGPRFPERGTGRSHTLVLAGALGVLRLPPIEANLNRPCVPV